MLSGSDKIHDVAENTHCEVMHGNNVSHNTAVYWSNHKNPTALELSLLLADIVASGIPTTRIGPDGMPVSGVRPVCPSAKLSNPAVNRLVPAVDVMSATLLPVDSACK